MILSETLNGWIDGTVSDRDLAQSLCETATAEDLEQVVDHVLLHSLLEEEFSAEAAGTLVDLVSDSDQRTISRRVFSGRIKQWGWAMLAACVVIAATASVVQFQQSAAATPMAIIQTALTVHKQSLERVYAVEVSRANDSSVPTMINRQAEVSTQGDRFWVAVKNQDKEWAWGRERDGSIWLAVGPRAAMRIDFEEVGKPVESFSQLYSLNIESLLSEVLQHCELNSTPGDDMTHIITAHGRNRDNELSHSIEATIEIDKETKAIRRLTLARESDRRSREVTFTLIETRPINEDQYSPEGHVDSTTRVIEGPKSRDTRRRILVRRFGRHAQAWIIDPLEEQND